MSSVIATDISYVKLITYHWIIDARHDFYHQISDFSEKK